MRIPLPLGIHFTTCQLSVISHSYLKDISISFLSIVLFCWLMNLKCPGRSRDRACFSASNARAPSLFSRALPVLKVLSALPPMRPWQQEFPSDFDATLQCFFCAHPASRLHTFLNTIAIILADQTQQTYPYVLTLFPIST